jgi:hypothetical protein
MTRPIVFCVLMLASLTLCSAQGDAQARPDAEFNRVRTLDDVKLGATLRVVVAESQDALTGRLRGFGEAGVLLDVSGSPRELPLRSILRVEESYRDRKRGAIVGVLVALVGVYAWDFFGPHPRYTDQDKRYKENIQALAVSVPAGLLIGGGIGWHRWRPVSTAAR